MFYLYYRKDILKAAGVAVPKTQQEFTALTESSVSAADAMRHARSTQTNPAGPTTFSG